MTKRLPRPPRRPPPRTPSRAGRWDITKLLTKPPSKGGPIPQPRVPAKALERLRPPELPIQLEAGSVTRGALLRRNVAKGLAGYPFDMPVPDPARDLLWAELRITWFFNGWKSEWPKNSGSSSIRVEGSVDWYWFLTGNPFHFDDAPIFLTDGGGFEFETSVSPGARGFDVGWICPARAGIFTNEPDKQDERNTSPLQRLLSLRVDDELKLWFAMDFRRASPHGTAWPFGATRMEYVYAYIRR